MFKELITNILRFLRNKYLRLRHRKLHEKLVSKKLQQKNQFNAIKNNFSMYYEKLKRYNIDKFTTPLWKKFNKKIEKSFLPIPSFYFLNNPTIMISMFATRGGKWLKDELSFLEDRVEKKKLKYVLEEDYAGDPLLLNSSYLTSHTAIHHLYHFVKFLNVTGCKVNTLNTIVEWGGGYGSLIRLLKRFIPKKVTYIIIDTPLFTSIQWLYLYTIFGEKEIGLLLGPEDKIQKNKINLVALPFLNNLNIKSDLFISTWALSESSQYSQDYVLKSDWFGAKHLLLAYQDNPTGIFNPSRVGRLAENKGATIEDIEFLPGNHYAFY